MRLLMAQAIYGCAGIAFNVANMLSATPLTPTCPIVGIVVMLLYLAGLLPAMQVLSRCLQRSRSTGMALR